MNGKNVRKILSMALVLMMSLSSLAFAADGNDFTGHWAEDSIQSLMDKGFVKGYLDGSFKPESDITRTEFISIINRAFGFTEEADVSFTDVDPSHWAYNEFRRVSAKGYMVGYEDGSFGHKRNITRAEVASVISTLLELESALDSEAYLALTDLENVPEWAAGSISAVVDKGYMKLRDGAFAASSPATRAEVVDVTSKSYVDNDEDADKEEDKEEEKEEDKEEEKEDDNKWKPTRPPVEYDRPGDDRPTPPGPTPKPDPEEPGDKDPEIKGQATYRYEGNVFSQRKYVVSVSDMVIDDIEELIVIVRDEEVTVSNRSLDRISDKEASFQTRGFITGMKVVLKNGTIVAEEDVTNGEDEDEDVLGTATYELAFNEGGFRVYTVELENIEQDVVVRVNFSNLANTERSYSISSVDYEGTTGVSFTSDIGEVKDVTLELTDGKTVTVNPK